MQTVNVDWRYRLALFVNVQNLTNRANYLGYPGNLKSPLFGQPTNVANLRRVDMGVQWQF